MEAVRSDVRQAKSKGLIIDGFVSHTGDDIAILMSPHPGAPTTPMSTSSPGTALSGATGIAQDSGLYGAGQRTSSSTPPPATSEARAPPSPSLSLNTTPVKTNKVRPAESFCVFAAEQVWPPALTTSPSSPRLRRPHVLRRTHAPPR